MTTRTLTFVHLTGIDVSAYQPRVDWSRVRAAGHEFAFIKATEGLGWRSRLWSEQWSGARAAGLLAGPYHFGRWEHDNPEREAEWLFSVVGELPPGTLPPVLDLEWITGKRKPAPALVAWATRFLERATDLFGRSPIVYTGPSFWRYCLAPAPESRRLTTYPLWTVDYTPRVLEPKPMHGVDWQWDWWQWTGAGSCPGVTKADGSLAACDLNVFRGSLAELRLFAQIDTPTEPRHA